MKIRILKPTDTALCNGENYIKLDENIRHAMNDDLALFIKKLRVKEGCTWRGVCSEVAKKYPMLGLNIHPIGIGFTIDGKILCELAQQWLGEDKIQHNGFQTKKNKAKYNW